MKTSLLFLLTLISSFAQTTMTYNRVTLTNSPSYLTFTSSNLFVTAQAPGSLMRLDVNNKLVPAVIGANLVWDGETLTAIGGGGGSGSMYVNGTAVVNPNLKNGVNITYTVSLLTNITPSVSGLTDGNIANAAAINATKIADGSVANAAYQRIANLTSDAQTQLNGKVGTSRLISTGAGLSGGGDLSADRTLLLDPTTFVNNVTWWDGSQASRTWGFSLSGATDPQWTISNNSMDLTTGVLKYGGNTVATSANRLDFFSSTTSSQFFSIISDESGSTGVLPRYNLTSSAQGDVIYYNGTDWVNLAPGSAGQLLQTGGAGANPSWHTVSGAGDVTAASTFGTNLLLIASDGTGKGVKSIGGMVVDVSGNLSTPGTFSSGVGSTVAGGFVMKEGSAPALVADSAILYAPVDVAAGGIALVTPATAFSGILKLANSSGVMSMSQATSGTDYVAPSTTLTAGAGLSGGGDLSANRTFTLDMSTFVNNITTWDGSQATRTWTMSLSGATDPVWTYGNNSADLTTGVLKQGGSPAAIGNFQVVFAGLTANRTVTLPDANITVARTDAAQTFTGTQTITQIDVGNTDTSITRHGAGDIDVEGNIVYRAGGTDVAVADGGTGLSSGTSGGILYYSGSGTLASSAALAANAVVLGGGAGATPATTTTGSGVVTGIGNTVNAAGGFLTTDGTATMTGKTYDASATGNVLKQTKQLILQRPDYGDGAGAVPQTNTFTASGLMHYTFSGNAETNVNWVVYEFDCPSDFDTSVDPTIRFSFLSGGTDTDDYVFHATYGQVAAGTAYPTGTSISTSPIVITITPSSPANGDLQYSSAVTCTGWAAGLTAGRPMAIRIARLQNAQDDGARDVQLVFTYGSTL